MFVWLSMTEDFVKHKVIILSVQASIRNHFTLFTIAECFELCVDRSVSQSIRQSSFPYYYVTKILNNIQNKQHKRWTVENVSFWFRTAFVYIGYGPRLFVKPLYVTKLKLSPLRNIMSYTVIVVSVTKRRKILYDKKCSNRCFRCLIAGVTVLRVIATF